jgi:molecular chaperone DnaK (HSP70)
MKEVIGLRSKLDSLVRNTQRTFKEFSGALSPEERESGQRALNEGEAAASSEDPEEIRRVIKSVTDLAAQLTAAIMNPSVGSTAHDPNERL